MPFTQNTDSIGHLLARWQKTGDESALEELWDLVLPIVRRTAEHILRQHGAKSLLPVDDVASLVLTHLWQLRQDGRAKYEPWKSGRGYVVWLARNRSKDTLRKLGPDSVLTADDAVFEATGEETRDELYEAIKNLSTQFRLVIRSLLEGDS